ncbi:C-_U-editing enzyme APOBEC-1-like [Rhinoderma darwinii]|uniref:C->U-editing enzyme APOBEC-1-like n=1 Tax=Rhinoderma darwinii TaxID=43563 RepID=UPI003F66B8FE
MILMPPAMFRSHYGPYTDPPATHLIYEVYDGSTRIDSGHHTNTGEAHAEEVFLGERFRDAWKQCTIVWYISWSPCDHCLQILLNAFLPNNPQVTLYIIFAKVYKFTEKTRVRELNRKGVKIRSMCLTDFRWCWNHFVETTEAFTPWPNLYRDYYKAFKWIQDALYSD